MAEFHRFTINDVRKLICALTEEKAREIISEYSNQDLEAKYGEFSFVDIEIFLNMITRDGLDRLKNSKNSTLVREVRSIIFGEMRPIEIQRFELINKLIQKFGMEELEGLASDEDKSGIISRDLSSLIYDLIEFFDREALESLRCGESLIIEDDGSLTEEKIISGPSTDMGWKIRPKV